MKILSAIITVVCAVCAAYGDIVWSENFATFDNWKPVRKYEKDEFKTENNELMAICANIPYKGSYYQCEVPFIEKGELTFEVNVDAGHSGNYRHLSLQVKLYSMMTAFNGYGGSKWQRFDGKSWKNIGAVKTGEWVKCKITFDNTGAIEYYINDMENPAMVETELKLTPDKDGKAYMCIGNYGLAGATVVNKIRNMKLSKKEANTQAVNVHSGTAMIFNGIAGEYYQLNEILNNAGITKAEKYNLAVLLNLHAENRFSIDKLPSPGRAGLSELIVLADMPVNDGCLPAYVQQMIVDNVEKGGKLLILGGMFTLNKGNFAGTQLEKLVPGELGSQWQVSRYDSPLEIKGLGNVEFLHLLKVAGDASVLSKSGEQPFVVSRGHGKGKVIVCLGMPCGNFAEPFWQSPQWPKYITQFIN